jgi:hypothetical protein
MLGIRWRALSKPYTLPAKPSLGGRISASAVSKPIEG